MTELADWDTFYVIVGSAAGALVGLQFVVMTLIADRPPGDGQPKQFEAANAAFSSPTVVHFSVVLFLSAILRAPWQSARIIVPLWGLIGLGGVVYTGLVARRMRRQKLYKPQFEDWLFHEYLPEMAYVAIIGSAFWTRLNFHRAMFGLGASALLLLFVGIHNAWDAVTYHVATRRRGEKRNG